MSSLIDNATIKKRRDTASNWTSNNPTPNEGETCLETDTGYIKIGDGSTAWTSLDYQPNPAEVDGKATLTTYSTAWVSNSDWTGATLAVAHNLSANLTDLIVKVFVSSDGTEANAIETQFVVLEGSGLNQGFGLEYVDVDNINVITASGGVRVMSGAGTQVALGGASAYYYKVKVYKFS